MGRFVFYIFFSCSLFAKSVLTGSLTTICVVSGKADRKYRLGELSCSKNKTKFGNTEVCTAGRAGKSKRFLTEREVKK